MKRAKVLTPAAIGLLTAMVSTGTPAETGADLSLQSSAAFVEAYVYACQPVEFDNAGVREPLNQVADWVHGKLFLDRYNGSCRDFYFEEVVPRLDVELQPFFIPEQYLERAYLGTRPTS
jgi:hypothetical protein